MKKIFVLSILIASATTGFSQTVAHETSVNFTKLEWLLGTWSRTNISKPGRSSHERWEKIDPYSLKGFGVTMQGKDTVFIEKITILIKENDIYYVADVPENKQPVYFKLIEINDTGFICENPEHDFPKKISYQLSGTNLKAQISGNGKSVDYLFSKDIAGK